MSTNALTILLAEDDEGHAMLVTRNLRRAGVANEILLARDGQEALDLIAQNYHDAETSMGTPMLVVLDINMPRVDGIEVLRQLKQREVTAQIPVIMLTTTDDPREVERCYELGCSVYITKPVEYEKFVEAVRRLGLFLQIITVPKREDAAVVRTMA